MSTEIESLAHLLEVAEGKCYLEILFSFPLPYEVVLKYEVMREKTFERVGLVHSSTKIWKMQRDANNKVKLKTSKISLEETEKFSQEYQTRLETSHEITLKFAKYIEERLHSLHKICSKAHGLIDATPLSPLKFQNQLEELDLIRYKDFSRLKEMEVIELRLLDQLSKRHIHKEANLLVLIEQIKDKMGYYDHSVRTLEQQIDAIQLQHHSQQGEMNSKIQELTLKLNFKSNELEKNKGFQSSSSENNEKLREENNIISLQNLHLQNSVEELARNENQLVDRYIKEIGRLHDEIESLKRIIKSKDSESPDIYLEKHESSLGYSKRLKEVLGIIREITHNVFEKYGTIQSEWQDSSWKEELSSYSGEYRDLLLEIEFLCYMIVKLTSDNNWLVDRLADLGKENHKLKGDGKSPTPNKIKEDIYSDLRNASNALKEFEEARDKLLSQFS